MISEEKQVLIRKRLLQGILLKDIADEVQVSVKTVTRYKSKMPVNVLREKQSTGANIIKYDNSTQLTKLEEKFTKRLQGELALYEDEEEGWCYHITKEDYRNKTSGLWWSAIAYPESVPENWIAKLKATGLEIAISPLHDKDKWNHDSPEMVDAETGEIIEKGARYKAFDKKKAHWHIIIKSDKRMSFKEANALIRNITNGPYIQKCRSLRNQYEYFLHLNNPEKYQGYEKTEIQTYNNFHLEPNKYEAGQMQSEMLNAIRDNNFTEIWQFTDYYRDQPEYIAIMVAKPALFTSLINSQWKKAHPSEERIQKVQIVNQYGKEV